MLLQSEGYEVQGVHTPQDALHAVDEFRPEVVILDISMPGKSGWELAAEIRRVSSLAVLVALSGNYRPKEGAMWATPTFDHYLTKPCDPEALLDLVANLKKK
jgi:two-component system OmpR family response regulator